MDTRFGSGAAAVAQPSVTAPRKSIRKEGIEAVELKYEWRFCFTSLSELMLRHRGHEVVQTSYKQYLAGANLWTAARHPIATLTFA